MWFDNEFSAMEDSQNGKYNWITVPEIEKIAKTLVERYKHQSQQLERLQKENEELKNGVWEKNEIAKLKKQNEQYLEERRYSFTITKDQHEKIRNWMNEHKKVHTGAIGGRYEYRFFPTGVGTFGKVVDMLTKEEFKFEDLD